jgi:hypothetical protein
LKLILLKSSENNQAQYNTNINMIICPMKILTLESYYNQSTWRCSNTQKSVYILNSSKTKFIIKRSINQQRVKQKSTNRSPRNLKKNEKLIFKMFKTWLTILKDIFLKN